MGFFAFGSTTRQMGGSETANGHAVLGNYAAGDAISWPHPEMGKFALAAGILLFGDRSFGLQECPLSFVENDSEATNKRYNRFLVVFRVFADGTKAEYVAAAHPHENGLGTVNEHLEEFHK